jgi:hypothetical protein
MGRYLVTIKKTKIRSGDLLLEVFFGVDFVGSRGYEGG